VGFSGEEGISNHATSRELSFEPYAFKGPGRSHLVKFPVPPVDVLWFVESEGVFD